MKKEFNQIYQFKITLEGVKPPIWRRIQVPETYSFRDLHIAIQDAMGWGNYHSYDFYVGDTCIENDEAGFFIDDMWRNLPFHPRRPITRALPASKTKLTEFIKKEKQKIRYLYDLGDSWEHIVHLEKILPRKEGADYPICIAGKRACPPEDCGGVGGYENFLEIIEDPNHPEHKERMEWIGGEFDPEYFDVKEIHLRDIMKSNKPSGKVIVGTESYKPITKRKIGRNDPCPCGSGLKYKKCCLNK